MIEHTSVEPVTTLNMSEEIVILQIINESIVNHHFHRFTKAAS